MKTDVRKWLFILVIFFIVKVEAEKFDKKDAGSEKISENKTEIVTVDPNKSTAEAVKRIKGLLDWGVKQTLPFVLKASNEVGLSTSCMSAFMKVITGIKQMKDWAAKMVDASSKLPSGILLGTTSGLGSYDECVDVVVQEEKRGKSMERFRGQYCLIDVWPPKSLQGPMEVVANASGIKDFKSTFLKMFPERRGFGERLRIALAVCVPSSCTPDDVLKLATYATKPLGFSAGINNCQVKTEPKLTKNQWAIICVLSPIAFLIIVGTALESVMGLFSLKKSLTHTGWKGTLVRILTAFSLYANTRKFLNVKRENNSLGMLSGIRFLSITWIILGHSYYFPHLLHYAKFKDMFTVTETQFDLPFMVIQNTALAVDSFFLVSGFLVTYTTWKKMVHSKGSLSPIPFFLKRIMRMLPAQFLVMGILMLLPLFGSGPLWSETWKDPIKNCEKDWWSNMLFIQNLWGLDEMCLFQTWFLAIAMQLHLMAFFILILLYRFPVFGIAANIILTVGGAVTVSLITLFRGLAPTFSVNVDDFPVFYEFYNLVYIQIYSHFGPYCLGILLGYYMITHPCKVPKLRWRFLFWLLSSACSLAAVYGLYAFTGGSWTRQHPWYHTLYAGTFRTAWAVGVAWVVYDCIMSPKSIINSILSWKAFAVLDRLTFLAYLFHPIVMYFYQARLRETINTDYIDMIYYFLATTVITYIIAFFFHVTIEQPVNFIDAFIFQKPKPTQKPDLESNGQVKEVLTPEMIAPTFNPCITDQDLKNKDSVS